MIDTATRKGEYGVSSKIQGKHGKTIEQAKPHPSSISTWNPCFTLTWQKMDKSLITQDYNDMFCCWFVFPKKTTWSGWWYTYPLKNMSSSGRIMKFPTFLESHNPFMFHYWLSLIIISHYIPSKTPFLYPWKPNHQAMMKTWHLLASSHSVSLGTLTGSVLELLIKPSWWAIWCTRALCS